MRKKDKDRKIAKNKRIVGDLIPTKNAGENEKFSPAFIFRLEFTNRIYGGLRVRIPYVVPFFAARDTVGFGMRFDTERAVVDFLYFAFKIGAFAHSVGGIQLRAWLVGIRLQF